MTDFAASRAAFFSIHRSYLLGIEAGLPSAPIGDQLMAAARIYADSIEALEVDSLQKCELLSEMHDAFCEIP